MPRADFTAKLCGNRKGDGHGIRGLIFLFILPEGDVITDGIQQREAGRVQGGFQNIFVRLHNGDGRRYVRRQAGHGNLCGLVSQGERRCFSGFMLVFGERRRYRIHGLGQVSHYTCVLPGFPVLRRFLGIIRLCGVVFVFSGRRYGKRNNWKRYAAICPAHDVPAGLNGVRRGGLVRLRNKGILPEVALQALLAMVFKGKGHLHPMVRYPLGHINDGIPRQYAQHLRGIGGSGIYAFVSANMRIAGVKCLLGGQIVRFSRGFRGRGRRKFHRGRGSRRFGRHGGRGYCGGRGEYLRGRWGCGRRGRRDFGCHRPWGFGYRGGRGRGRRGRRGFSCRRRRGFGYRGGRGFDCRRRWSFGRCRRWGFGYHRRWGFGCRRRWGFGCRRRWGFGCRRYRGCSGRGGRGCGCRRSRSFGCHRLRYLFSRCLYRCFRGLFPNGRTIRRFPHLSFLHKGDRFRTDAFSVYANLRHGHAYTQRHIQCQQACKNPL